MTIAIVLSGGTGTRMGQDKPKQYMLFRGRPILCYALQVFERHPQVDKLVIVADVAWRPSIDGWLAAEGITKFAAYANPGENRQLSILNGLTCAASIAQDDMPVIIHDAARPLVSAELLTRCLAALPGHDGVMPALPVKDTCYLVGDQAHAAQLLPRERLVAGQAPEVFRFGPYYRACLATDRAELLKINGTTELALKKGMDIVTVPGDERNIKITTPNDLVLLDTYLIEVSQ